MHEVYASEFASKNELPGEEKEEAAEIRWWVAREERAMSSEAKNIRKA